MTRHLLQLCLLFAWAIGAQPLLGQTIHITLQEKTGGSTISGRFLGMTDSAYLLSSEAGRFSVDTSSVDCVGRACPVLNNPAFPEIAPNLKRIELSALDGQIDIEGKVRGFANDNYIVDIPTLGIVRLQRSGLRCSGPGCRVREILAMQSTPTQQEPSEQVTPVVAEPKEPARVIPIIGEKELTETLLYPLLMEFVSDQDPESQLQRLSRSSYSLELGTDGGGIFVGGTGLDATFSAFVEGAADFALASRRLTDTEAEALIARGLEDIRKTEHETVVTVDSLSVVVNAATGIDVLELSQLAAIYRGEVTNWADLGGEDAQITVASREVGSSANTMFNQALFGATNVPFLRGAIIANSTQEMTDIVANDRYAVGYLRDVDLPDVQKVKLVGECGLITTQTPFSRLAEDGLMQQRIYLYSHPHLATETGRDLREFALSVKADSAFAQTPFPGFDVLRMPLLDVPSLSDYGGAIDGSGATLAQKLVQELPDWDRLSTTVRFPVGEAGLGQKEQADITRLISYLTALPQGSEIALVGFADTSGGFDINLRLAAQRAALVERTLLNEGKDRLSHIKVSSRAYGELAPIVCNTTENGRALNRRVEVWLKTAPQ